MTVLWIIIICFVVAIVAGTIIAMARKQQTLDIEESTMPPDLPPDAGGPLEPAPKPPSSEPPL